MGAAGPEIGVVNGVRGEVVVAFDDDGFVALGQYLAIPDCFCHVVSVVVCGVGRMLRQLVAIFKFECAQDVQ